MRIPGKQLCNLQSVRLADFAVLFCHTALGELDQRTLHRRCRHRSCEPLSEPIQGRFVSLFSLRFVTQGALRYPGLRCATPSA